MVLCADAGGKFRVEHLYIRYRICLIRYRGPTLKLNAPGFSSGLKGGSWLPCLKRAYSYEFVSRHIISNRHNTVTVAGEG